MNDFSRTRPAAAATTKPRRPPAMAQLRKLHAYVGMLIAPAVVFFAATGIVQIYGLHEAHPGYSPPGVVQKLGMLHKNQVYRFGRGGPPRSEGAPAAGRAPGAVAKPSGPRVGKLATQLLKAVFALASAGLIFSTVTGVWMALLQPLRRRAYLILLAAGTLVPAVLTVLSA